MFDFEEGKKLIGKELDVFNQNFVRSFTAEDQLLHSALQYLIPQRGKQLRPMTVVLGALICGEVVENTYRVAVGYELLHTASLIHDDVVDNSSERRNRPSLNKIFDNRVSVLVGDFLITKAFGEIYQTGNMQQIGQLQKLSFNIIRGELLQHQHSHSIPKEDEYYLIIKNKTAALFATCIQSGALSAGASEEQLRKMYAIGENLGMCFQIKDDIFDYSPNAKLGKPIFNDITEGKATLPLIYAFKRASSEEQIQIREILTKKSEVIADDKSFVFSVIQKYGGIGYAAEKMNHFRDLALQDLESFADSDYKSLLADIIHFSAERDF